MKVGIGAGQKRKKSECLLLTGIDTGREKMNLLAPVHEEFPLEMLVRDIVLEHNQRNPSRNGVRRIQARSR